MSCNFTLKFDDNTNTIKMSASKPLIERKNKKLKDIIRKIKPRETNLFERLKNRITNFFGKKFLQKSNIQYRLEELTESYSDLTKMSEDEDDSIETEHHQRKPISLKMFVRPRYDGNGDSTPLLH